MPVEKQLPTVVLVDNSVSVTGALKCAVQQALVVSHCRRYVLVLPQHSNAVAYVLAQGVEVQTLPLLELQRDVAALLRYPSLLFANTRLLCALMQRERATTLVMNDYYNLLGACVKMRMPQIRLVTFVRFLPAAMPALLNRLWTAAALRYADCVVAVSEAVRKQLPNVPKVQCIYDSLHLGELHGAYQVRPCSDRISLLYMGNYIRGKGQDHALRTFELAYQKDRRLRLTFMGCTLGLAKNEAFKAGLKQYVYERGLAAVVKFLPFVADVESAYKSADIFLNFSEAESFSMTCAEAAFYGVPTIASRCGGPEEIIVDGETGMLRPNKDVAAFTVAILKLAGDVELRHKFSRQCYSYVRTKFNKQDFVNKMEQVLLLPKVIPQVDVPQ